MLLTARGPVDTHGTLAYASPLGAQLPRSLSAKLIESVRGFNKWFVICSFALVMWAKSLLQFRTIALELVLRRSFGQSKAKTLWRLLGGKVAEFAGVALLSAAAIWLAFTLQGHATAILPFVPAVAGGFLLGLVGLTFGFGWLMRSPLALALARYSK